MLHKFFGPVTMIAASLALVAPAQATILAVVGLFRDKAMVRIDGAPPRLMSAGQTVGEVKLVEANSKHAVFRVAGNRHVLELGQSFSGGPVDAPRPSVVLKADTLGHFSGRGEINGVPVDFLIDTGATTVVIDAQLARKLRIDYQNGERLPVATANGVGVAWRVALAEVKLGPLSANQIDGVVIETGLGQPLLGASFLNRMDMKREGGEMTLSRRY